MSYPSGLLVVVSSTAQSRTQREAEIARLAASQQGVFTREQARNAGFSKTSINWRLGSGLWERVYAGVYRLPSAPPSWHSALMAALLWAGEEAVLSHRAAAALWELSGIKPGLIELTLTRPRRPPAMDVVLHRSDRLPASDKARLAAFRITSVSRTLIDLGSVVAEEVVEQALDDALTRGLTSIPRLRWRLQELGRSGRRGAGVLRKLLNSRAPGSRPSESTLETRVMALLRSSRLPTPIRQYEIREKGRVLARIDLAYPEQHLAIECDGYRYHSGRKAWQEDLKRRNLLARKGWRVLHVTWEDLKLRPNEIVREVKTCFSSRSASNGGA
jgi:very-short-patch-repair endonuclease